jgi:hypothetical protein
MNFANAVNNFHSSKERPEFAAVRHMNLRATAEFPAKFVKRGLEIIFAKENARQLCAIQFTTKLLRISEWRAEDFKRSRCAAPLGNICAFKQTHSGINRGGVERRHVRRRHDPRQTRLIEPHRAFPVFHRQNGQLTVGERFIAELLCEFAKRASMPDGNGMHADKRLVIWIEHRPFSRNAIDWVWSIQHHNRNAAFLARAHA